MKLKGMIIFLLVILIVGCHSEMDDMYGRNPITDTFILVDYYSGVYKFVQIDNQYTIGVVDGLLEIPDDFTEYESEETFPYYKISLVLTGINPEEGTVLYQRYTGNNGAYLIKQEGVYERIYCSVQRTEFFNDYFYYLLY